MRARVRDGDAGDVGGSLLRTVVDAGVPVLVFFTMVVQGMEPTTDAFWRVARQPGTVVGASVGQFILLSVIGWLLVGCLTFQPAILWGKLLFAACPSGAMANLTRPWPAPTWCCP